MDELSLEWHDIDFIVPNPWNPNVQNEEMFQNTIASICSEGFIDPVTVRMTENEKMQILDGEHRWKALKHIRDHADDLPECVKNLLDNNPALKEMLDRNQIPTISMGAVDDDTARRVTLQLNGIKGKNAPERLASLIQELREHSSLEDLTARLPMTKQRLFGLLETLQQKSEIQPESQDPPEPSDDPPWIEVPDRWVSYTFTFPFAAQGVIDSELDRISELLGYNAQELTDVQRGLTLEKICVLSADTPTESLE